MIPILFLPSEKNFNGKGVGELTECTSCIVTEERNGIFEATLNYPLNGRLYSSLNIGGFIMAKANENSLNQIFRIYKISRPINNIVTLYCEHIRYSLSGIPVKRGIYSGTPAAIMKSMANSVEACNFEFWSDISTTKNITLDTPSDFGSQLGGLEDSILDTFGGEYEFNNFTVKLHNNRGSVLPVTIEYGKNLTGFTCETDSTSTYTHIYPYYYNESEDIYIELDEKRIKLSKADGYPFERCYMMDLSSEFETTPTKAQLKSRANDLIRLNHFDEIKHSYSISFVPLWQTEEYKDIAILERCALCDTITVIHKPYGIKVQAKIIKTIYDTLAERYTSMELGNAVSNFANTVTQSINNINQSIKNNKSYLDKAVDNATKLITGQKGGYLVLNPAEKPQELLIMDTDDINTAVNVWRFNSGGLGHSSTGYNGKYGIAITMDGKIVADYVATGHLDASLIDTGQLNANIIKTGTLQGIKIIANTGSIAGWKMENGVLVSDDGTMELDSVNNNITVNNAYGSKLMTLSKEGVKFWRGDTEIGQIGIRGGDTGQYGLTFDLIDGDAMTWSVYDKSEKVYVNKLRYTEENGLNVSNNLTCNQFFGHNVVKGTYTDSSGNVIKYWGWE